jgi:protein tyrosine phosphatase type 4A
VQAVVRVCEPSYDTTALKAAGVRVLVCARVCRPCIPPPTQDWEFSDGSPPPKEIRDNWIELIRDTFRHVDGAGGASPCIAVHCVAGLGRAPVMVAIALIEAGVKYEDAVDMIRKSVE